jgi:hypothetical protein
MPRKTNQNNNRTNEQNQKGKRNKRPPRNHQQTKNVVTLKQQFNNNIIKNNKFASTIMVKYQCNPVLPNICDQQNNMIQTTKILPLTPQINTNQILFKQYQNVKQTYIRIELYSTQTTENIITIQLISTKQQKQINLTAQETQHYLLVENPEIAQITATQTKPEITLIQISIINKYKINNQQVKTITINNQIHNNNQVHHNSPKHLQQLQEEEQYISESSILNQNQSQINKSNFTDEDEEEEEEEEQQYNPIIKTNKLPIDIQQLQPNKNKTYIIYRKGQFTQDDYLIIIVNYTAQNPIIYYNDEIYDCELQCIDITPLEYIQQKSTAPDILHNINEYITLSQQNDEKYAYYKINSS